MTTKDEVIKAYTVDNLTKKEIVMRSKFTINQVRYILRDSIKIDKKHRPHDIAQLTKEKKNKILTLWAYGYSEFTISQDQEVRISLIRELIHRNQHIQKII